ncbi:MAG TPA: ABC-F family ATP-binding cassette domain-containing protein, partial [Thermomicrobiales bacterium]|nr:ABC-F family ATP-binding cassette domain-containing protein [Thermomicrobiales bacterium]
AGDDFDAVMAEYGESLERFDRRGGYDLDYRIDIVFAGLRISHLPRQRPFSGLSGGEKARVLLATLLLRSPDVLLLDEPTNHLDFASIAWLEDYLSCYRGGVLVISHDRHFLNGSVTRIVEIDEHTRATKEYTGNYDAYLIERQRERAQWEVDYAEQQDEIKELKRAIRVTAHNVAHNRAPRDPAKMAYDFKGGRVAGTISRNIRSAEERLRRIEADPIPKPPSEMRIAPDFSPDELRSEQIIVAEGIRKQFGPQPVLDGVNVTLGPRDRVVIVGPNGAGKSTLLDILAGRSPADAGTVSHATGARLGYLDQDGRSLDPAGTVLATYRDGLIGYEDELIADLFRHGLFTLDDLDKRVGDLSAGQLRKLQLARLMAERGNVLLLDEPTNHLAFDILEEFEKALIDFPGPILAVSHDRWFIQRFVAGGGIVWELDEGRLQPALDPERLWRQAASVVPTAGGR